MAAVLLEAGIVFAALAVGYVLVMSVLGTTPMRYSGHIERVVAERLTPRASST